MVANTGSNIETLAFFDVDDTIIRGLTIAQLVHHILPKLGPLSSGRLLELERMAPTYPDRPTLTRDCFRLLAGNSWSQMVAWGEEWYERSGRDRLMHGVTDRLREHLERGDEVVFVSGSWLPCLMPIARDLGVRGVFCSEVEVIDDHLTGDVSSILIGEAKALLVKRLAAQRGIDLADCYAYGDDASDTCMLNAVGRPVAVQPSGQLADVALLRGWTVIDA